MSKKADELETSIPTIIGILFQERRIFIQKSQTEVAKHLEMTSAGWGKIENGKSSLSVENMLLACEVLEVKPNQLMSDINSVTEFLKKQGWLIHKKRIKNDGLVLARSASRLKATLEQSIAIDSFSCSKDIKASQFLYGSATLGSKTAYNCGFMVAKLASVFNWLNGISKK